MSFKILNPDELENNEQFTVTICLNDNKVDVECSVAWNIFDSYGVLFVNINQKSKTQIEQIIRLLK